jgi:hypothetical protein
MEWNVIIPTDWKKSIFFQRGSEKPPTRVVSVVSFEMMECGLIYSNVHGEMMSNMRFWSSPSLNHNNPRKNGTHVYINRFTIFQSVAFLEFFGCVCCRGKEYFTNIIATI